LFDVKELNAMPREIIVAVRLNEDEKARLALLAAERKITPSAFLRRCLALSKPIRKQAA